MLAILSVFTGSAVCVRGRLLSNTTLTILNSVVSVQLIERPEHWTDRPFLHDPSTGDSTGVTPQPSTGVTPQPSTGDSTGATPQPSTGDSTGVTPQHWCGSKAFFQSSKEEVNEHLRQNLHRDYRSPITTAAGHHLRDTHLLVAPADCKEDLLEDVADADFSASSIYVPTYEGYKARLTNVAAIPESLGAGGWGPHISDLNSYIQVKFNNTKLITGISTKGRNSNKYNQWVTGYSVLHSTDGVSWVTVQDVDCNDVMFKGNEDRDSLVKHELTHYFRAKYVRIHPIEWKLYPIMRFGVSGCDLDIQEDPKDIQEDPKDIQEDPKDIQEDHKDIQEDPKDIQDDPKDIQEDPKDIQEDPKDIQEDPKDIQEDPKDIQEDPKDIQDDPKDIQEDPKDIQEDPKDIQEDPKDIQEDPKDIQEDPKDIQEDPKDIQEDPKDIQEDPKDIQGDPKDIQEYP
ncbi:hypothetical protein ScPMuIL_018275 [Solemya velum]